MAEYKFYTYSFTLTGEIKCCDDCPFGEESYEGCKLYSYGCVDRYHYKEYHTGRPSWCKLSPKVKEVQV